MTPTIIQTSQKTEVINVTETLAALVGDVDAGVVLFSVPHTTVALVLCEDDGELRGDLVRAAENWLANCRPFSHTRNNNPNAEAHIISAFAGTSVLLPIQAGKLALGTYQNILLLEMDGPKPREVRATVIPALVT
jgi:secondary thiamine-phosphate synthase enzyme